jgi:outer membrane protein assembly factor BamA
MNQTSLITLWVDPDTHQIVKYTFDNVWLDFLPAAWLVRVDAMRASMTMFQPFEGVWLPRRIDISAGITLANGSFSATYTRAFYDYREADVQTRIKIPKQGDSPLKGTVPLFEGHGPWVPVTDDTEGVAAQGTVPVVREVRVHGNAAVPGDEVLRIAGVQVGMPLAPDAIAAIERRLKDSGRFETVDVRMRYRSLSDPTDVALVLVVHEKTGVTVGADGRIERPLGRRIASRIMFLPVLSYADGYGFTYGARFSTVDLLGAGERLSVPLTWGGTRRAALEAERTFSRSPFTRILGSAAIWQRENPRHEIDDRRIELKGRVERSVAETLYAGLEATRADVAFGAIDDQLWTIGADAAIDTRGNPAFPANAVYLSAGWTSLHVDSAPDRINRYTLDGRGYLRVFRQSVLAGRVRYTTADAPLPIYERWLIGGSDTLRGFRAGSFEGDKALVTSAELRVPITSVLNGSRVGINIFIDAAKTAPYGLHLDDAEWERGAGAGLFLIASIVRLNLDVARSVDGGGTRVHFSTGFGF